VDGEQRQGHRVKGADIHLVEEYVEVSVDQARHERPPAKLDTRGGGRLDRAVGNFLDALAFDQDLDPAHEFAVAPIEEASAGKQEGGHGEACAGEVSAID